MRLLTREQAHLLDQRTQREYSVPGEILMEAAGAVAADHIQRHLPSRYEHVGVVCGPGNNGGDGLVLARHLQAAGVQVCVFVLADDRKKSDLFVLQQQRLQKLLLPVYTLPLSPSEEFHKKLRDCSLLVDALFGIGLRPDLSADDQNLILTMNRSQRPIVALDIPSGLCSNRGCALPVAVKAIRTLTFGSAKPGFFVNEGPEHVGRLTTLPIGFPKSLVKEIASTHFLFGPRSAKRLWPRRISSTHKAKQGHLLLLAGSANTWGAGLLSARAAYRMGSGYVTWASHVDPRAVVKKQPEILTRVYNPDTLLDKKWSAIAVGPGLGTAQTTQKIVQDLLAAAFEAVVLDADALTVLAQTPSVLPATWILTPHAGELSRLLNISSKLIEEDRFYWAREAALKFGCVVLLKGYRTVVSDGQRTYVIHSGNAALAKAGSGDVLTGFIGSLLAQGLSAMAAACLGAYVHGRLADIWVDTGKGENALMPMDLIENLQWVESEFSQSAKRSR